MSTTDPQQAPSAHNIAETLADLIKTLGATEDLDPNAAIGPFTHAEIVAVAKDRRIEDLTGARRQAAEYLKPARRRGTATLTDLDSLVRWALRFRGGSSALFANDDKQNPSLTCIADYHESGAPDPTDQRGDPTARHCAHRAVYKFPLSDEWKEWMSVAGKGLDKDELGEFIEKNAKDIFDPSPAILAGKIIDGNQDWENRLIRTAQQIEGRYGQLTLLLAMSRHFQVYETSDLTVTSNRDTGEASIQFLNEHKDADGAPLRVPNLIIIGIPVFRGGALYRLPVRFRYRKQGSSVKFILSPYNPERAFDAAFREAVEEAQEQADLPLFFGTPES
jgi:hypothetical protein